MGYTHQVVLFDRDNNDKPWVFWDLEGMPFSANLRWKCFVSSTRNNIYDYGSGINFNQIRMFWSNKLAIIHYIHSSFIDSLSPLNPLFVVDFSASHVWFGNWPFPLGHPKLLADVRRTQSQGHCLQRVPGMDGSSPAYWTMVSEGAVYQPTSYQFPSKNHGFSPKKKVWVDCLESKELPGKSSILLLENPWKTYWNLHFVRGFLGLTSEVDRVYVATRAVFVGNNQSSPWLQY